MLHHIKSKYLLQKVFDYLTYETTLKLVKGSSYLSKCLDK